MPQLWVKKIQPEIEEELNKRKKYLSYNFGEGLSDNDYQQWNAKTPWITVYSNVLERKQSPEITLILEGNINGKTKRWRDQESDYDGGKLAKQNTFRGLLSIGGKDRETFDEIYKNDLSDPYALRPVPTLEGLTVENLDDKGAVRKSTIEFTCYTFQQLEDMEKLYMSPGASIVVQWGWNTTESSVEAETFENKSELYKSETIKKKIRSSGGNYGALLGVIGKFSWNIQDDGSIACSTEIVSRGYIEPFENIKENSKTLFDDEDARTITDVLEGIGNNDYLVELDSSATYEDYRTNFGDKLKPLFLDTEYKGEAIQYDQKHYLSIQFIFNLINIFYSDDAGYNGEVFKNKWFTKKEVLTSGGSYNKTTELPVLIGNRTDSPILRSLDRDIFIIPRERMNPTLKLADKTSGYWGKIGVKTWKGYAGVDSTGWIAEPVDRILVNLEVVKTAFENSNTYADAVKNILAQLNEFSNGFWELKLENDDAGFVRIVDKNFDPTEIDEVNDTYKFPAVGQYSMAQSVTVASALPDQMKNAAAYSGVGNQNSKTKSGFGTLYGNIRDDYNKGFGGITRYPGTIKKSTANEENEKAIKFTKKGKYFTNVKIDSKYWAYIATQWGLSEDNTAGYTSALLIPLDLSLTIDGIEGLEYGNVIAIDYLPERYKNNSGFIITSISHNIGRDGWTTTLGTQFRVTPIKNTTNETKDKIKLNYWNYIPVNGSRPSRHRE